jgi:YVTN family beta-propeller protein
MQSLRKLAWIGLVLSAVVFVAQAKTNYAYVANSSSNTVSVINTANGTVVTSIPVEKSPWGVAVNQAGAFVYVTNKASNTVSVISTSTNTVVATIPVGTAPAAVAFAPKGTTAYVANQNSNSVSVINTGTKIVTASVTVQSSPVGLAVMPNDTFVYVANKVSGKVSVISTLSNTVAATIPVGSKPIAVAISPDGSTAYVTNSGSNTISVIQTANNAVVNTINVSPGPYGAAVSPDGHWLYVANSDGNNGDLVTIINTASQTIQTTVVAGTGPQQVAFSEDSATAEVTNIGSNNVTVIDTASMTVKQTIPVGLAPIGGAVMGTVKVTTVAGGYVGDGGPATNAAVSFPYSTVQDKAGNYYVTDRDAHRIRKITPTGTITTIAGTGICGYNGDNIKATKAMVCYPSGLAFDSAGNLYVADSYNQRVRKISTTGTITTVAGTGSNAYNGDGGPATSAAVGNPWDIAFDAGGNLYFSDATHNVVRKVNTRGTISTYAGTGFAGFSGDGGPATAATMNQPTGVGFDPSGNLYIADTNNYRVRIVTAAGTINTFAGNGNGGCKGDGGLATAAAIGYSTGTTIHNGVLYIANGCGIRAVDLTSNLISTFAGSRGGYDGDGNPPLSSRFNSPRNTLFDAAGNFVVDDTGNGRLRKLSGGVFNTFAGGYLGDGNSATSAALVSPEALAIDKSGNFYIADYFGNRVRKVSGGKISTIAGTSVNGYSGDGGAATAALLNAPRGVAVDSTGNVFIADNGNKRIRKVDTAGTITTFATNSNFCDLLQMAIDSANNLYVADDCTSVIFKITPAGVVRVFAGVKLKYGYNGDNIPATTAWLNRPVGVAVDTHGNVLIADTYNSRVREVNTAGTIGTIAGDGNCNYTGDGGAATSAELCLPGSAAVSSSGTIYIVDSYARIRKISGGIITAFAGSETFFNADGLWPLLTGFSEPVAVAVDSKGAVYVVDDVDHRVRKIQ